MPIRSHTDDGPKDDDHKLAAIAQRVNGRCPIHQRPKDTNMSVGDGTGWAATRCKAIHAGTEDEKREDEGKSIAYLRRSEFYDEEECWRSST